MDSDAKYNVALYMSAWIEIRVTYTELNEQLGRTLHECVD